MKRFLFLSIFYLFISLSANAKKGIDSLHLVLSDLSTKKRSLALDTTLVNTYCEIGKEYIKLKNDSALNYLQKALIIATQNKHKPGILKTYVNLGRYYTALFLPIKALEYCFKALALAEELELYIETRNLLRWISYNYMNMNDFNNALIYYKKLAELNKSNGHQEEYLLTLINIGVLYSTKKDFNEALKYYQLCEKLNKSLQSSNVQSAVLVNLGKTQAELKQYDEALITFKEANKVNDVYNDKEAFVNNEIAKIYLHKKNLKDALAYATTARIKAQGINIEAYSEIAKTLSEIQEALGNTKMAHKYYKEYANLKLREDSTKNSQLIRLLQLDYENELTNKKIAQINLRNQEKDNKAKLMGFGLIALLILISIVLIYYASLANKNKLIESQKADIEKLNESLENKVAERTSELVAANDELLRKNKEIREALLKGQTMERERVASELHDNIGGTLSALKWRFEALDKDSLSEKEQVIYEGILKNMHRAYGEVRLISHNMLPAEFEEKGLVGALEKFMNDLNISSSKTQFRLDTSQLFRSIRQEVALEVYISCFEIINNTIKHAEATEVRLEINEKQNGDLEIVIEDNGKGFDPTLNGNGKGLRNIANRVDKINGKLSVSSELNNGSRFTIQVPELFWEEKMVA